jgi:hypothetical protein
MQTMSEKRHGHVTFSRKVATGSYENVTMEVSVPVAMDADESLQEKQAKLRENMDMARTFVDTEAEKEARKPVLRKSVDEGEPHYEREVDEQ